MEKWVGGFSVPGNINTALIVCGGAVKEYGFYKKYIDNADIIICADGGAAQIAQMGADPDIILGDMDSIERKVLDRYIEKDIPVKSYPSAKNKTDSHLAVDYALFQGAGIINIIGGTGSRLDHSINNIFLLKHIFESGARGFLIDENNIITITGPEKSITITKKEMYKVSLIPLSAKVKGVTTNGMQYPLENYDMEMGFSLGISNEFSQKTASVTVKEGLLLVIMSRD